MKAEEVEEVVEVGRKAEEVELNDSAASVTSLLVFSSFFLFNFLLSLLSFLFFSLLFLLLLFSFVAFSMTIHSNNNGIEIMTSSSFNDILVVCPTYMG